MPLIATPISGACGRALPPFLPPWSRVWLNGWSWPHHCARGLVLVKGPRVSVGDAPAQLDVEGDLWGAVLVAATHCDTVVVRGHPVVAHHSQDRGYAAHGLGLVTGASLDQLQ
ncbi:MAG: hypothetical protein GFH23_1086612n418 [Chloroflexi bacterium AL-N1]|nr:hypothetical protein [Chloroflexi bacterium AL-N1]NOK72120.1 hypothetical protein [Chloroflexi bacterium AL-N5]